MLINTKLQELLKIEKDPRCVKMFVVLYCHSVSAMALRDTGKRKQKDSIADPIYVKVLR